MNDMRIQQALQQMQALAAQAGGNPSPGTANSPAEDFAGTLQSAIETVNGLQQSAAQKTDAFLGGGSVPLAEVVIAGQKSRVAFEALKEVRNHLLTAYREISQMQV